MDILKNSLIKPHIHNLNYFDLKLNNERLGVVMCMNEEDSEDQLQRIFADIIANKKINYGYYQLRNIFANSQLYNSSTILNLIIQTIKSKVNILSDVLFSSKSKIDIGVYTQVWNEYTSFNRQMYQLLNNHQRFLTEKNITISNRSNNILGVTQLCIFYDEILGPGRNILDGMLEFFEKDCQTECILIDQIIDFIDAMRVFLVIQSFTKIDKPKIIRLIRTIVSGPQTTNQLCLCMHNLLLKLGTGGGATSIEPKTVNLSTVEKPIIIKIYKLASILAIYAEKEKLLVSYSKFLQVRIMNLRYTNLELEMELVKRISGAIGKDQSQKLANAINDIYQSKAIGEKLHTVAIKNVSNKYNSGLVSPDIIKMVNPLILVEKNWKIKNTVPYGTHIEYPTEIRYCLDIVSKLFSKINESGEDYTINWQFLLGMAEFEAQFKLKRVLITCNFAQAICISYINEHQIVQIDKFVSDTHINQKLAEKLFESLVSGNILIYADEAHTSYIPNINNYVGESKIDLHLAFIETFNPNKSDYVEPVLKSKFVMNSNQYESISETQPNQFIPENDSESDADDMPIVKPSKKINSDFSSESESD